MALNANIRDRTSGWVELEEKVPDDVPSYGGRGMSKTMTVLAPGKGKKGKGKRLKLRIPRSMIPEVKRQAFAAFWDMQAMKNPSVDTTAARYNLFDDIALGTGSANRLGDAVFVEKIVIRLMVHGQSAETFGVSTVAVVMDTEPASSVANWLDMFSGIGAGNTGLYDVAIPEQDERFRFRYLREVRFPHYWSAAYYNAGTTAAVIPHCVTLDIPIKRRVMYDATQTKPVAGCNVGIHGWSDTTLGTWPRAYGSYEIFFRDA
jgi:hypothetical protein